MSSIFQSEAAVEAIQVIDRLRTLADDWDLEGAKPLDSIAVTVAAMMVIRTFEEAQRRRVVWEAPEITPLPSGGVILRWGRVPGVEITACPGMTQVRVLSRYEDGPNNVGLVSSGTAVHVVVSYFGGC